MNKDEANEIIDENVGGNLCQSCPYFIEFDNLDIDCMVDTSFHCPYVELKNG